MGGSGEREMRAERVGGVQVQVVHGLVRGCFVQAYADRGVC